MSKRPRDSDPDTAMNDRSTGKVEQNSAAPNLVAPGTTVEKKKPDPTAFTEAPPDVEDFEEKNVHEVYENIASHFSSTRYKPWPMVKEFIDSIPVGSLVCDVGCGNGKNIGHGREDQYLIEVGCDRSANLLSCARDHRNAHVARCDGLKLSYRAQLFDAAISIAVIHHFTTPERRQEAIAEILRVLRPGGRALIYVWAVEQKKDRGGTDVLIDWEVHSKFDDKNTVHRRYYHLFRKGELEELVLGMQHKDGEHFPESLKSKDFLHGCSLEIEKSYFDKENWCVILQKKKRKEESDDKKR